MFEPKTYVEIYKVILKPENRANQVPLDTKSVPFEMRLRGFLLHEANIGDLCQIQTATHRVEEGLLVAVHPSYHHDFGHYVPILGEVRSMILDETEDIL